ncbi:hypothetical protein ACIBO2_32395 [Nonomuraea sp. NPDC050022]|uniref:hypothetical protein n=1 Tax=unclassified Nonomuraea TaxID=2593643 RepID=UPI0033F3E356
MASAGSPPSVAAKDSVPPGPSGAGAYGVTCMAAGMDGRTTICARPLRSPIRALIVTAVGLSIFLGGV